MLHTGLCGRAAVLALEMSEVLSYLHLLVEMANCVQQIKLAACFATRITIAYVNIVRSE